MATRGVPMVATYRAWDTGANAPKTGDAANHTLRWIKDGSAGTPSNSPAEVDATNTPGIYKITITSTETDCTSGTLAGKSSAASVYLFGAQFAFDYIPVSAATQVDASGYIKISNGTGTGQLSLSSGTITVGTNNDKTGYALSVSANTDAADTLLNRDMSLVSDTNARTPLNAMRFLRNKVDLSVTPAVIYKENDSTTAWTTTLTTSSSAQPVTGSDPA